MSRFALQAAFPLVAIKGEWRSDFKRISLLTGPILFAMVMQSAYSLIDVAFVGKLGREELASVGVGAYLTSASLAILVGLATGVQALSAEAIGREATQDARGAILRAAIITALIGGIAMGAIVGVIGGRLVELLASDRRVASAADDYFMIRAVGLPSMALNVVFRGYWKGVGRPIVYSLVLCATIALNILLDWLLIFGNLGAPRLGLTGAAIGFALSATLGAAVYLAIAFLSLPTQKARGGTPLPFVALLKRSLPAGIQQLISVLTFPAIMFMLGKLGTTSLAAGTILLNLSFSLIILGQAFGFASATLACEAIGAGNVQSARIIVLKTGILAAALTAIPGSAMVLAPARVLDLFTNDPEIVAATIRSLRFVGIAIAFDAFGMVVLQTMLTAGAGVRAIAISLPAQWLVAMPLSYVMGARFGIDGVFIPQVGLRIGLALVLSLVWFSLRTGSLRPNQSELRDPKAPAGGM